MIRATLVVFVALAAAAVLPSCAEDAPVNLGAACEVLPEAFNPDGIAVQMPTLECQSRRCLAVTAAAPAINKPVDGHCTEECASDAECAAMVGDDCLNGFVCAVPTVEGPFCCRSMCVCRDDLARLPANQPAPLACDAADPANTCQNLPGRPI